MSLLLIHGSLTYVYSKKGLSSGQKWVLNFFRKNIPTRLFVHGTVATVIGLRNKMGIPILLRVKLQFMCAHPGKSHFLVSGYLVRTGFAKLGNPLEKKSNRCLMSAKPRHTARGRVASVCTQLLVSCPVMLWGL